MSSATFAVPVGRFVWKEYRALRGLWLGVLVLGLLVDAAGGWLLTAAVDAVTFRLVVAFAAAALYAAGAASVVFALEHEEETYAFLRGVPATWGPMYVGKVLLVAVSAVLLALVLAIVGVVTGGFRAPAGGDVGMALGVFGVAVLEAVAWGTLCSLVFRRPMAAAVATLVVGVLAVNMAVNLTNSSMMAASDLGSYVRAVPLRLGIVAMVFALSGVLAPRWFEGRRRLQPKQPHLATASSEQPGPLPEGEGDQAADATNELHGRPGLGRLVWQSWRESWRYLPLPVSLWGVSVFLPILLGSIRGENGIMLSVVLATATMFFAPTMFGALAFSADQRRGQVRFFAERAARPRWVWLSRHVVWLGSLAIFMTFVCALAVAVVWLRWTERVDMFTAGENQTFYEPNLRGELQQFVTQVPVLVTLAFGGVMVAYAMGQACSMVLRSEILAGFLALVLAVVLSGWIVVLYLWQLSGWVFLVPVAVALMVATWLRAPGWIAGRNSWRAWWRPVGVVVVAMCATGGLVPVWRLEQVAHAPASFSADAVPNKKLPAVLAKLRAEAEETAAMYIRAAEMLGEQRAEAFKLAIEASQRPTCRFEFQLSRRPKASKDYNRADGKEAGRTYEIVQGLLMQLAQEPAKVGGDVPFEQLMAALRMNRHVMMEQPTAVAIWQLRTEWRILEEVAKWANGKERTNDERRAAIAELQKFFDERSLIELSLFADGRVIERVLNGQEASMVMATTPVTIAENLAFVANELPWERKRAILALDIVTQKNVDRFHRLRGVVHSPPNPNAGVDEIRKFVKPAYQPETWQDSPAATSYFFSMEYQARVSVNELGHEYCNTEAVRRATLIRVALAAYRAEHEAYPETLAMLAPEYLPAVPVDPYSFQPFRYVPKGLDLPLTGFNFVDRWDPKSWIPAGTPLLWSVGINDLELVNCVTETSATADGTATNLEEEPRSVTVTDYSLEPANVGTWWIWESPRLVFELRK